MAKRRELEELLTFLFAILIQYMCFCLMISSHSGCCTLNYIVLGCTLFSPKKLNRNYYLLDKVGQKEQGLLPSKNCGLTVSHFRAIARKSFYIFVRYTYSRTARKPNTFSLKNCEEIYFSQLLLAEASIPGLTASRRLTYNAISKSGIIFYHRLFVFKTARNIYPHK